MSKRIIHKVAYRFSRDIQGGLIKLFFKVRVHGLKNVPEPPYLAASNHASHLDPPLLGMACRKDFMHFMAKRELFEHKLMGWWFSLVDCIKVDRQGSSVSTLKESVKCLKHGRSVAIFPEGTRSEDGQIQDAKRGTGFIIAKSRVPVLPVFIDGTSKAFPRGGKMRFGTAIDVYIGEPITPDEFQMIEDSKSADTYGDMACLVMSRIQELKQRAHSAAGFKS
jgi:1-acyl-sn-glycerol-3-phosphate acyltransferase